VDASPRDRRLTERGKKKCGVVGGRRGKAVTRGRGEPSERGGDRRRGEERAAGEGERSSDNSRHGLRFGIGIVERRLEAAE
jgi:hypothetical protein